MQIFTILSITLSLTNWRKTVVNAGCFLNGFLCLKKNVLSFLLLFFLLELEKLVSDAAHGLA